MSAARVLELRGEAEALEAQANALRAEMAGVLQAMRDAGLTVQQVGDATGYSKQAVSQILRRRDARAWGPLPVMADAEGSGKGWLARQASEFQLARHAQEERAARASLGYSAEGRAFYGDPSLPTADLVEERLTWSDWVRHAGAVRA